MSDTPKDFDLRKKIATLEKRARIADRKDSSRACDIRKKCGEAFNLICEIRDLTIREKP